MSSQIMDLYLTDIQPFTQQGDQNPEAIEDLLKKVLDFEKESTDLMQKEFFKGEYSFYKKNFENALKHYSEARYIDHIDFYKNRVLAYLAKNQGDLENSMKYIDQALSEFPTDYFSLIFLKDLLIQSGQYLEAKEVTKKLNELRGEKAVEKDAEREKNGDSTLTFEDKEIEELAGIFGFSPSEQDSSDKKKKSLEQLAFSPLPSDFSKNQGSKGFQEWGELEKGLDHFKEHQNKIFSNYMSRKDGAVADFCLHIFEGWDNCTEKGDVGKVLDCSFWFAESLRRSSGGFYFRWNGKGIVVNPGKDFLSRFHAKGLHILDIDYVINTDGDPRSYADIKKIWEFNYQLNKHAGTFHLISYFLNYKAYQELSTSLKPHFKQEREAIRCLEFFIDSPEMEQISLDKGLSFSYFSLVEEKGDRKLKAEAPLGFRFSLSDSEAIGKKSLSSKNEWNISYINSVSHWIPSVASHIQGSDLILIGLREMAEKGSTEDWHAQLLSMVEKSQPTLLLCTEFGGEAGDMRLETVKKLRMEQKVRCQNPQLKPSILPANNGMSIDLRKMQIKCSANDSFLMPEEIQVVRPYGFFGDLYYLSSKSCL